MIRFFIGSMLAVATLANSNAATINSGLEGDTLLIFVHGNGTQSDEIDIELRDSVDGGQLEELEVRIRMNDDDEVRIREPAQNASSVYLVIRTWGGNDECVVESRFVLFDDRFSVYFEGGTGNDTFDASDCDSFCWALGQADDDILIGSSVGDVLNGGDGFDQLSGRDGPDDLRGGYDNDVDIICGDDGADQMGLDVFEPVLNRSGAYTYQLAHSEIYADFDFNEGDQVESLYLPIPRTTIRRRR